MLKKQKPTETPARFETKSMNSLCESIRGVCDNTDYLYEQSPSAKAKTPAGFMPKYYTGAGSFGSPATTNPGGKGGSKPSHSGKNDPLAYEKYGLGIPALAYGIGNELEMIDAVAGKIPGGRSLSILGLDTIITKLAPFFGGDTLNFGGVPGKTPNRGGFKGI